MRTLALSMVTFAAFSAADAQRAETGFLDRVVTIGGAPYRYQVYVPSGYAGATTQWPVILFLHGAGERGSDGLFQTQVGLASAIRRSPDKWPAIVVMPQVPRDSLWVGTPAEAAMAALDRTMSEFRTDPARVYLTGMSMGGNGTWNLAYRHPDRFAAIAPVCAFLSLPRFSRHIIPPDSGDAFPVLARRLAKVPTWIFHGEADNVVPVTESRKAYEALKAVGAPVRYTELLGVDHNAWDPTYGSEQFREWLFAQRKAR